MRSIVLITFILISFSAFLQKEWGLEYRQKAGFLAAHRGVMSHLAVNQAYAGELSLFFHPKGQKQWHASCGYPNMGATLFGGSVGNNAILGTFWGAYGFIEFPFVKTPYFQLYGKAGAGLGYATKVFSNETNPKNVAMSTHGNALICLGIKSQFTFGRNAIVLGIDMTHFSNGAYKVPNLGVNLPYLSFGYGRTIQTAPKDSLISPNVVPLRKWLFGVTAITSVKEVFPTGMKKYPIFALSFHARYFTKPKVGLEASFDLISKQAIQAYRPEIAKSQWDILQMGVFVGYLLPLDQFHFTLGMGVYLKDKYQPEDAMYHRVGIRYYFKNGLNTQVVLKSHWAKADYVEWGLGYTLNYKKK